MLRELGRAADGSVSRRLNNMKSNIERRGSILPYPIISTYSRGLETLQVCGLEGGKGEAAAATPIERLMDEYITDATEDRRDLEES